jgi:hypothetical protein
MPFSGSDWQYRNVAISKQSCPSYEYELPPDFVNSSERFIVIRTVRCIFGLTTEPFQWTTNDVCLFSDLCTECDLPNSELDKTFNAIRHSLGYICLCNDPNAKKKRFKYDWKDHHIKFGFARIDGLPIIPSAFLIDLLLVWK